MKKLAIMVTIMMVTTATIVGCSKEIKSPNDFKSSISNSKSVEDVNKSFREFYDYNKTGVEKVFSENGVELVDGVARVRSLSEGDLHEGKMFTSDEKVSNLGISKATYELLIKPNGAESEIFIGVVLDVDKSKIKDTPFRFKDSVCFEFNKMFIGDNSKAFEFEEKINNAFVKGGLPMKLHAPHGATDEYFDVTSNRISYSIKIGSVNYNSLN